MISAATASPGMMKMNKLTIVGGGLAGSEAAWQAAQRGWQVELWEMRPNATTPAHNSDCLAELVCSNSLGSKEQLTASGVLQQELRQLGSLVLECAEKTQVPAGSALAVDREKFAALVTEKIINHPNIILVRKRVDQIPPGPAIIATGPLTDASLAHALEKLTGRGFLYFYDAAAPIIDGETIDYSIVFAASRYGKGQADYLNCPFTEEEYREFWHQLSAAKQVALRHFEKDIYYEACLPVEELARRGYLTLAFGPLRPVGLQDPRTDTEPFAVVQLRKEDVHGNLLGIVGFQTNLTWPEQKRVFRLIPGLAKAEFARYGVMHRNTYVDGPKIFSGNYRVKDRPGLYIAGQLSGVEGYLESTCSGLVAALDLHATSQGRELDMPEGTISAALARYVATPNRNFQPMNANFGLLPAVAGSTKRERRAEQARAALEKMLRFTKNPGENC